MYEYATFQTLETGGFYDLFRGGHMEMQSLFKFNVAIAGSLLRRNASNLIASLRLQPRESDVNGDYCYFCISQVVTRVTRKRLQPSFA